MKDAVLQGVLTLISIVSLASLGAIIIFISPYSGGVVIPILFSLSLFLFFVSAFTLAGLWVRDRFITSANRQRIQVIALREGFLLSVLLLTYLWLARAGHLRIWVVVLLVVIVLAVEYYFLAVRRKNKKLIL